MFGDAQLGNNSGVGDGYCSVQPSICITVRTASTVVLSRESHWVMASFSSHAHPAMFCIISECCNFDA